MENQTFLLASIVLCSLGGWYVVVTKYLTLKRMINDQDDDEIHMHSSMHQPQIDDPYADDLVSGSHIAASRSAMPSAGLEKRLVCNHAAITHLLGFSIIAGVPFLNVLLPAIFWLWKKEQHPFLAKQGREVVNFQITYTLIQFACLGAGVLFIRYAPMQAAGLFAFTKISKIVFASGMYLPFNVFTIIPFFWCCIVMIRGAVAAYHGVAYKYPFAQQFIFANQDQAKQPAARSADESEPNLADYNKVHFS